jgi:hypothetical protein
MAHNGISMLIGYNTTNQKLNPKMETKTKLYQINPSFKFKLSTFESDV